MRLRTFESFWLVKNGILNSYPSLCHDEWARLVVIGGGITGALVSHALMEKNYEVILIDKRDIASGSTAATTSMLQYEIDVPLYKLAQTHGERDAAMCYKEGIQAIHQLEELVKKNNLDCGYQTVESLFIARSKNDARWLKTEFEIRDKHNLGVRWLEKKEILKDYGIKSPGAILSSEAASVDAYRLAHELIALNVSRGMKVYDQTDVENFDFSVDRVTINILGNHKVNCEKVIFCTGYEAGEMLKEKPADLFYTYACVSERGIKLPPKLAKTLVWDTGDPYFYMRTTDDDRLLIGGEDSNNNLSFFQNQAKKRKSKKLQKTLKKLIPDTDFIEDFSWGGTFGSTKDGLPYIGESLEHKEALFVLGYGGNGIVFSVQAMQIITDILEGKENTLGEIYRFGR